MFKNIKDTIKSYKSDSLLVLFGVVMSVISLIQHNDVDVSFWCCFSLIALINIGWVIHHDKIKTLETKVKELESNFSNFQDEIKELRSQLEKKTNTEYESSFEGYLRQQGYERINR